MKNIKGIIAQMTNEEKASLCSGLNFWYLKGVERLGIPSLMVTDGPHGLRKQATDPARAMLNESVPATCFPTGSALAATWNRDLVHEVGMALGEECRHEKVAVILGPGANIKRSPLCGRNFEYFSEDPYLTGEIAKSHIRGVQSQGVGTSLKHFAVNNQESRRMTIDAIADERTLREIYLAGFETAVKEGQPWTVMCSYNRINGTFACENRWLLTNLLREEWGFEGLVVTDWGAMDERVASLEAGLDLEMPGVRNGNDELIVAAVDNEELEENVLDRAVERNLELIFRAEETLSEPFTYDAEAHHALARRAAAEGVVLLKNEGGLLPLKKDAKIALLGRFAIEPRYQGAGSSLMNPSRLDNLYDELVKMVGEEYINYAEGYNEQGTSPDDGLIREALTAAEQADVVIVCAGLTDMYEVEGVDRSHMKLPEGHEMLIRRIAEAHRNLVVVLSNGSPVEMPWAEKVPAILEGYLGGQAGAGALADILTGRVNPSGKLAETFPLRLEDTPAHPYPGGPAIVEYRESCYVGYRWYDSAKVEVLFPFGHGLSYTSFAYRDLQLTRTGVEVIVTFKVKNTGEVEGKEIAQVYVRDMESAAFRPYKELKGFTKVLLRPGEEKDMTIRLGQRAFAYYDVGSSGWVVEAGEFEILVGASSRDIRLAGKVSLPEQGVVTPVNRGELITYHQPTKEQRFPLEEFETLLGRSVPANKPEAKGGYTLNTPIREMRDSVLGRRLYRMLRINIQETIRGKENTPTGVLMMSMAEELPMRSFMMMGGRMKRSRLEAMLHIINGKLLKGLLAMFRVRQGTS